MMLKIFIPSMLVGCMSLYGIYRDYVNRQKIKTEFLKTGEIDGKKLMEGIITCDTNPYPILRTETFRKKEIIRHYFNPGSFFHRISVSDFWFIDKSSTSISPNVKFDNKNIVFDPNSKIFYTKYSDQSLCSNMFINKKYIPNNSFVTVFGYGDIISPEYTLVKYIGSRQDVINEIAFQYYDVYNAKTCFLFGAFIISLPFCICYLGDQYLENQ